MAIEEDLTVGGKYTMQYTDDVSRLCIWNLCNVIKQCHPNNKNIYRLFIKTSKCKIAEYRVKSYAFYCFCKESGYSEVFSPHPLDFMPHIKLQLISK